MAGVERVPVHIPGVEVVGDFPIKRFLETIYNAAAKQYGVKLNATILPPAEDQWATEIKSKMGHNILLDYERGEGWPSRI